MICSVGSWSHEIDPHARDIQGRVRSMAMDGARGFGERARSGTAEIGVGATGSRTGWPLLRSGPLCGDETARPGRDAVPADPAPRLSSEPPTFGGGNPGPDPENGPSCGTEPDPEGLTLSTGVLRTRPTRNAALRGRYGGPAESPEVNSPVPVDRAFTFTRPARWGVGWLRCK